MFKSFSLYYLNILVQNLKRLFYFFFFNKNVIINLWYFL